MFLLCPNERKSIIRQICVDCNRKLNCSRFQIKKFINENLLKDVKLFSVDWTEKGTNVLMIEFMNYNFDKFDFALLGALNMTDLVIKFGINIVQCKIACSYLYNMVYQLYLQENENRLIPADDKMRFIGR